MEGLWWWRGGSSGCLLRLVLFNIFIHNLQNGEYTKSPGLWIFLTSLGQSNAMTWGPAGSHKTEQKAHCWHKSFSVDKCRVTHVEENNPNQSSLMLMTELAITARERDPEVAVNSCLRSSAQCASAVKKSQQNIGKQQKECWGKDKRCHFVALCTLSMPHTESSFHAWSLTENRNIPLTISAKD